MNKNNHYLQYILAVSLMVNSSCFTLLSAHENGQIEVGQADLSQDLHDQDADAISPECKLVYGAVTVVSVAVIGIGAWYLYTSISADQSSNIPVQNNIQVVARHLDIAPVDGCWLSDNDNQRVNNLIQQGLADGRPWRHVADEVRQMFPDIAFHARWVRQVPNAGPLETNQPYPAWNNDPYR